MNCRHRNRILFAICTVALASALVGFAALPLVWPVVGVPTGEFDRGLPVYRLPTITVTAIRSVELARQDAEVSE